MEEKRCNGVTEYFMKGGDAVIRNSTYMNLSAEMAREGVLNRDLAQLLNVRPATIGQKMANGTFSMRECKAIKKKWFKQYTLDYLFCLLYTSRCV